MRSVIAVGAVALLALQSCQTPERTGTLVEIAQGGRSAAPSPPDPALRLRTEARAYAERLNQGRCNTPERREFDTTLSTVESILPVANAGAVPDAGNAAPANQVEVVAEARLDVADAARHGGCPEIANLHYHAVIRASRGPAFARFRQRAELGLSAMQL